MSYIPSARHMLSEVLPTFHNVCGKRTLYRSCQCDQCKAPFALPTKGPPVDKLSEGRNG